MAISAVNITQSVALAVRINFYTATNKSISNLSRNFLFVRVSSSGRRCQTPDSLQHRQYFAVQLSTFVSLLLPTNCNARQESCAIAKMTARCTLYMSASRASSRSRARVKLNRVFFVRFLVSSKFPHVPLGIGGWTLALGYEERRCSANCPCN